MAARINIGNAESQFNKLRQHALDRRRAGSATILSPMGVQGRTSSARGLYTTLGGVARPINQQDLATFRARIAEVGTNLRPGVTAAEAINLSRPIDRERANAEIRYAAPTVVRGGDAPDLDGNAQRDLVLDASQPGQALMVQVLPMVESEGDR